VTASPSGVGSSRPFEARETAPTPKGAETGSTRRASERQRHLPPLAAATPRAALLVASLFASQALLVGCGGGGESTAAITSTSSSEPAPVSESTSAHPPKISAAQRHRAGNAAPFLDAGADNSVPTFGHEASPAVRSAAEANLRAYLKARAAEQWSEACSLLAASVRGGFEKLAARSKARVSSCAKILSVLAPLKPGVPANPLQGSLLALRVKGANAFALFQGPPTHQDYIVPMRREGGAWRPTQTAVIAYPPATR
jgi:hypothetical protein